MGASHKYDLTSEITHLIVGEYDTPKYRYVAKERPDVKVLTPEWIEAVRQLWIEDKAVDVAATEKDYTLPTLASLIICLTGFEDRESARPKYLWAAKLTNSTSTEKTTYRANP